MSALGAAWITPQLRKKKKNIFWRGKKMVANNPEPQADNYSKVQAIFQSNYRLRHDWCSDQWCKIISLTSTAKKGGQEMKNSTQSNNILIDQCGFVCCIGYLAFTVWSRFSWSWDLGASAREDLHTINQLIYPFISCPNWCLVLFWFLDFSYHKKHLNKFGL